MEIKFKELTIQNFKSHQDLQIIFGEILTQITGDNAKGKSSIGEAITFLLYGNDLLCSKLDPTPDTYDADFTKVELLFEVDEKPIKLGREIINNRNKYIVNDVPSKATDFNEVVEQLFDRELFYSLFNPSFFFTMHWQKQREMVLQYVTAPANKEVLAELSKPQADKLGELVKKHSLEDLEKIHRENRRKLDREYIAAQSRTKTLKEQLDQFKDFVPLESLNTELAQLTKELNKIEKITNSAGDSNIEINAINSRIESLTEQIDQGRKTHALLKNRELNLNCHACGQEFTADAKEASEKHKQDELDKIASQVNPLIIERKNLREELSKLEYVDVSEQLEKSKKIQEKINSINQEVAKHSQYENLKKQSSDAEKAEKETLESLNGSIFILDAIKAFDAKEAELQAAKVQGLFETLSIRLFDTVKSTGELKPTFVVQMDGKDYVKLSTAEKIKAGLELRDVLSEQSNLIVPCFVDNAESITKFKEPNGQLIMAKVVEGKDLIIESEDA